MIFKNIFIISEIFCVLRQKVRKFINGSEFLFLEEWKIRISIADMTDSISWSNLARHLFLSTILLSLAYLQISIICFWIFLEVIFIFHNLIVVYPSLGNFIVKTIFSFSIETEFDTIFYDIFFLITTHALGTVVIYSQLYKHNKSFNY